MSDVLVAAGSTVDPLANPPADPSTEVGPGMQFAREWIKRVPLNRSVLLVPTAIGGSSMGNWQVGGGYHNDAVTLANAAITAAGANARVVAFLWIQGEAEAVGGGSQAGYEALFDPMVAHFRSAITGASSAVARTASPCS